MRGTRARRVGCPCAPLSWGLSTAPRAGNGGGAALQPVPGAARPLPGPAAVSAATPARPPGAAAPGRPRSERAFSRPGPRERGGSRAGRAPRAGVRRPRGSGLGVSSGPAWPGLRKLSFTGKIRARDSLFYILMGIFAADWGALNGQCRQMSYFDLACLFCYSGASVSRFEMQSLANI